MTSSKAKVIPGDLGGGFSAWLTWRPISGSARSSREWAAAAASPLAIRVTPSPRSSLGLPCRFFLRLGGLWVWSSSASSLSKKRKADGQRHLTHKAARPPSLRLRLYVHTKASPSPLLTNDPPE